MTLREFSIIVGTPPRWIQNAMGVLGLSPRYTVERARKLALARVVRETSGMPLRKAHALAGRALAAWPRQTSWREASTDGSVALCIDLERFLSTFTARLSLSRSLREGRSPGRARRGGPRGLALAEEHGLDVGLLRASIRRSPEERLQRLDEDRAFVRSMRPTAARARERVSAHADRPPAGRGRR
jgi:hypothetical protein